VSACITHISAKSATCSPRATDTDTAAAAAAAADIGCQGDRLTQG